MSLEKVKIDVAKLEVGMHVCELDRSWLETPFVMQGFQVKTQEEVEAVSKYCHYVYIDIAKSAAKLYPGLAAIAGPSAKVVTLQQSGGRKSNGRPGAKNKVDPLARFQDFDGLPRRQYHDASPWRDEMGSAKRSVTGVADAVTEVIDELREGYGFKLVKLKRAVVPMVHSIVRNPDACMWLSRMKKEGDYLYMHSVATSVWAVALGRELGLPVSHLKSLALGALLLDIGKLRLPGALLQKKAPLTHGEQDMVRQHVEFSLEGLKDTAGISAEVWQMVAAHHERHNGSGYPQGLREGNIPLFARIASIADCYDAMTSQRPYAHSISPFEALKRMYEWRDQDFQSELIEQFIQTVGIYPAGSLVLLNSGEVAIVVAEGRTRRLRPQVLLLLDKQKKPIVPVKMINLLNAVSDAETGQPLEISGSLEMGSFGVDTSFIEQASAQLG